MHGLTKYLLPVALLMVTTAAPADEWNSNINFAIGYKNINDDYFDRLEADEHFQAGIMVDFSYTNWPVYLVLDRFRSHHSGMLTTIVTFALVRVEMTSEEYNLGVRKVWQASPRARPYLGGGIALLDVEYSEKPRFADEQTDSADGTGYWYGGGIYFTLAGHFNIGLDVRHSAVDVTLLNRTVDAGGTSSSLIVGFHW